MGMNRWRFNGLRAVGWGSEALRAKKPKLIETRLVLAPPPKFSSLLNRLQLTYSSLLTICKRYNDWTNDLVYCDSMNTPQAMEFDGSENVIVNSPYAYP
jgi:hypothetical protein